MRGWLTRLLSVRERPLRDRLAALVAAAVASAVAVTGIAAWLITNVTVYNQLDAELVDIAAVTANWVAVDIEGMGGLDSNALTAANVTVMLLRSDGRLTTLPGEKVSLTCFGVFERVHRSARMVRNPATGSRTPKDAMFVPRFRAGLLFKRAVEGAAESNSSQEGMGVGERA